MAIFWERAILRNGHYETVVIRLGDILRRRHFAPTKVVADIATKKIRNEKSIFLNISGNISNYKPKYIKQVNTYIILPKYRYFVALHCILFVNLV